jgi:sulfur dioxygenase
MIFNQFFDEVSYTYTYLISSGKGREALIIDPVIEKTDTYISYLKKLDLKLVKVIDTHIHADHVSGLKELQEQTDCATVMGEKSLSEIVSIHVKDNEQIKIENIILTSMYTPGHTDCSYSFLMNDRIFTGDTLLINGTGRTDFQNGSSYDQYYSIFDRILKLPEKTFVYPAHDYKGNKVSTIGSEKKNNPRLQVKSLDEYSKIMSNLKLSNPKMMDIAVPANIKGLNLKEFSKSIK